MPKQLYEDTKNSKLTQLLYLFLLDLLIHKRYSFMNNSEAAMLFSSLFAQLLDTSLNLKVLKLLMDIFSPLLCLLFCDVVYFFFSLVGMIQLSSASFTFRLMLTRFRLLSPSLSTTPRSFYSWQNLPLLQDLTSLRPHRPTWFSIMKSLPGYVVDFRAISVHTMP